MRARFGLGWFTLLLCLALSWSAIARADDEDKRTCAAAFANAQRLMRAGSLLEARSKLLLCGGPQCPQAMHPDCQQWLSTVEASLPTVVFQASAAPGAPTLEEVQLSVDGAEPVLLDGRAISMNPGGHDIALVAKGFQPASRRIVVSEGEKLRRESVTLAPVVVVRPETVVPDSPGKDVAEPNTEARQSRVTVPVVVATSVAVLTGLGAVYLGLKARSDDRALDGCAPSSSCSSSAVDQVRSEYLWTNVSIGLAAASITTAAVLFLVNGRSPKTTKQRAFGIGVGPVGLGPALTGSF